MNSEQKVWHAWWSAQNNEVSGHVVYLDKDGTEVKVSGVHQSKSGGEEYYRWDDKVYLGEVVGQPVKYRNRF